MNVMKSPCQSAPFPLLDLTRQLSLPQSDVQVPRSRRKMTTSGVKLAMATTSFLLSLLDVKQQLMTGSSNLNSYSGHANRLIRSG